MSGIPDVTHPGEGRGGEGRGGWVRGGEGCRYQRKALSFTLRHVLRKSRDLSRHRTYCGYACYCRGVGGRRGAPKRNGSWLRNTPSK